MKTAMQELRLKIQSYCGDEIFDKVYKKLFDWHIEKEKEQICNAYTDGLEGPYIGAEEYYNQTYK